MSTEPTTVAAPAPTEQNRAVAHALVDAINDRRLDRLRDVLAPDVVDHNKIIFGEADEPGAAFDGFAQQLAALDPWHLEIRQSIAEGDRVVLHVRQTGVLSAPHPRTAVPTHSSFDNELIVIFRVEDGLIRELWAVSDRLTWFQQVGLLPQLD